MKNNKVTGIILAGGASSRMGNDKGLCNYKGKPLIFYAINVLNTICDDIIISSNNPESYSSFGYKIVADEIKKIGPLGGIYSCLKYSQTTDNLIISCDMPHLTSELMYSLLSFSAQYDIVVSQHVNSYYEPLAGYYSSNVTPVIERFIKIKDYKLLNLFEKVKFKSIPIEDLPGGASQFKNFNTPIDLID